MKNLVTIILVLVSFCLYSQNNINYRGKSYLITEKISVENCQFIHKAELFVVPEEYCKIHNTSNNHFYDIKYILDCENYDTILKLLEYHDYVGNIIYLEVLKTNKNIHEQHKI